MGMAAESKSASASYTGARMMRLFVLTGRLQVGEWPCDRRRVRRLAGRSAGDIQRLVVNVDVNIGSGACAGVSRLSVVGPRRAGGVWWGTRPSSLLARTRERPRLAGSREGGGWNPAGLATGGE